MSAPTKPDDPPSLVDLDADTELDKSSSERATSMQSRAEKWVAGIAAIAGLVATVLVIKGPESAMDIPEDQREVVARLFAGALAALAVATVFAYCAAFGSPFRKVTVKRQPLKGVAARLLSAKVKIEKRSRRSLGWAIVIAFVGVGLIAGGVGVSWFATDENDDAKAMCIKAKDGTTVARVPGTSLTVTEWHAGYSMSACL
jgi:hypothetical protein